MREGHFAQKFVRHRDEENNPGGLWILEIQRTTRRSILVLLGKRTECAITRGAFGGTKTETKQTQDHRIESKTHTLASVLTSSSGGGGKTLGSQPGGGLCAQL